MFAFPLSVCFWFLYIANMLLIYFPCFVWLRLILLFSDNNASSKSKRLPWPQRGIDIFLTSSIINHVAIALNQSLRPFTRCPDKSHLLNSSLKSSLSWDRRYHPSMHESWSIYRLEKALLLYISLQAQFEHQSSHILWYRILSLLKSHYIFVVTSSHCGIMCGVNDAAMVIKCPCDDLKQKQFSPRKSLISSTYFYDGLLIHLLNIYCFLNKSNLRRIQLLI